MRRADWVVTGVALIVGLAACGGPSLSIRPESRAFTPSDYERIYDAWTRSANDFSFERLEDVLHVTATFEAWEFRWAYIIRYAEDYSLRTEERTRILRASLSDAEERHRFLVTMAGAIFRESDLTDERGAWRVLMVDPEGRLTRPIEIQRLRRPGAPERVYFPSISTQRQTFRVAFPTQHADGTPVIAPGAERVVLRFTGAQGVVDLQWDLVPASGGGPRATLGDPTAL